MKKYINYSILVLAIVFVLSNVSFAETNIKFDSDIYFGLKSNSNVTKLQEFLTQKGFYSGPITGNFFSLTLSGVKNFQKANKINPTGYFGPLSRATANKDLAKIVPPAKLTLTSPTNPQVVKEGESQLISWTSENYPENVGVSIYLLKQTEARPTQYAFVKNLKTETPNDGQETWVPQADEVGENMLIQIGCSPKLANVGCSSGVSSNTFTVQPGNSSNLANVISATE